MEGRALIFLLNARGVLRLLCMLALLAGMSTVVVAEEQDEAVIQPRLERREVALEDIDTENLELGIFAGVMNVEDFGSSRLTGLRLAYHATEYVFVEGQYARTRVGLTSYERLSGDVRLLTDEERNYEYYDISLGLNLFPGESFVVDRWTFTTDLYVLGGAGATTFAGEDSYTVNFGAGFRLLLTDWLAVRVEGRDHVFESDLLGTKKRTHNIGFSGGLTLFF